jgi:tetratricopeptide (TPR) repeat protein
MVVFEGQRVEWVDVKGKTRSLTDLGGPLRSGEVMRSALALIALAALCSSTLAQETTAEDWIEKGEELLYSGSLEESVEAFNKAIELDPQNADAWRLKALTLRDQGDYDEAIAAFDRAIDLDPQDTRAKVEKAGTLIIMGRHEEAAASYERAVDAFEDEIETHAELSNVWRYQWMGEALEALGRDSEAEAAFTRARELGYRG